MTLSEQVLMRSFAGATECLISEPPGPAELWGRVSRNLSTKTWR